MFDLEIFEGPDGWERFKTLKNAMHIKAVDEFFEDLRQKANCKGENFTKIMYGSELKDGTSLTREDAKSWAERFGVEITERKRSTIDDYYHEMTENGWRKK